MRARLVVCLSAVPPPALCDETSAPLWSSTMLPDVILLLSICGLLLLFLLVTRK